MFYRFLYCVGTLCSTNNFLIYLDAFSFQWGVYQNSFVRPSARRHIMIREKLSGSSRNLILESVKANCFFFNIWFHASSLYLLNNQSDAALSSHLYNSL
jgi:hypothetical protein